MSKPILQMKGISKRFPGVLALDQVDLELFEGEVLAVLGENGAGKSTLLKILSGVYAADDGEIILGDEIIKTLDIRAAQHYGIGIIHQELTYFPELTVAENIFSGDLPKTRLRMVDWNKMDSMAMKELSRFGLAISPKKLMKDLSVAEQQLVEIVKALSKKTKILIMDEPTSALNKKEIEKLLSFVKELAVSGTSIIYISHRLEEIFSIADRVTILRDGKYITSLNMADANYDILIHHMVGRDIGDMYPKGTVQTGGVIMKVNGITSDTISDVSFELKKGEVLGLFGLMGSGRTDLAKTIFGVKKHLSGYIEIDGNQVNIKCPKHAIKHGLAYVPSERKLEGLVLDKTVTENIMLSSLGQFFNGIILKWKEAKISSKEWLNKLDIHATSVDTDVENLSGGNQQKVVIAKWLQTKPKVLILNEPTRGIDVGAKVEIYKIIDKLCREGVGILLISSELPEIMALSDRFIVICNGRLSGEVSKSEATQEILMNYAIGRK